MIVAYSLSNYIIDFCKENELQKLQKFINNHWSPNHIMSSSNRLMAWQHHDKKNKRYNFVIAKHKKTGKIHAILGFFPTSQYDSSLKYTDLALAIWKVRDDVKTIGLGVSLIDFLSNKINPRTLYGIGVNPRVVPIYKYMGFKVGKMNHYYIVNKEKKDFHLISNFNRIFLILL